MLTIIPHNEVPLRGFKWAFSWARRAEDVAPYQGCVVTVATSATLPERW